MFAINRMEEEAKQLFAYLELRTNNLTKKDTLTISLKGLDINRIKDGLIPEYFPCLGGTLLRSIDLILGLIEFMGDGFFYLIEICQ